MLPLRKGVLFLTEREKMEAGYLYLPSGELVEHRFKIQDAMVEYNKLVPFKCDYAFPVTIGDNVWIGGSVSIIGGVTIGKNNVIGAASVVIRDIPEGVLATGNPCRVIRKLTPEDREKYIHAE